MIGGVYFLFYMFLVSTVYWLMFMSSSLIYIFTVCCLKSRFILFACIFHTCGYAFCLSVSGSIQVDSIELLSTLATDG